MPPVRLSDELAYIATKSDMSNKTLKQTYPFDFDGNGMIKASRTPEDPAPLIRAHGLPFIAVARDTVALSGRKHTFLCAALLDKNDKNIKSARSAFTIGTIVATKTFVDMPRTIDRQLFTHSGMYPESRNEEATRAEANFPKESRPAGNARDTMSSLHNALATLMGKPVTVIRLIDLPAYRLTCGPGNDSTTIGESFVNKFATQPYSNLLALDYVNADGVQAPITQQAETAATPEKKKTRRSRKHEQTTQAKTQQEDKLEHHIDPLLRLKAGGVKRGGRRQSTTVNPAHRADPQHRPRSPPKGPDRRHARGPRHCTPTPAVPPGSAERPSCRQPAGKRYRNGQPALQTILTHLPG